MNYTIKVLEGPIDTSQVESTWVNRATGLTHTNVFALASVCDFPPAIKQGDEFYFKVGNNSSSGCVVCDAYYPTPKKRLSITVVRDPCN